MPVRQGWGGVRLARSPHRAPCLSQELAEGLQLLCRAYNSNPTNAVVLNALAHFCLLQGQYEKVGMVGRGNGLGVAWHACCLHGGSHAPTRSELPHLWPARSQAAAWPPRWNINFRPRGARHTVALKYIGCSRTYSALATGHFDSVLVAVRWALFHSLKLQHPTRRCHPCVWFPARGGG
jgi:hypothetical protein